MGITSANTPYVTLRVAALRGVCFYVCFQCRGEAELHCGRVHLWFNQLWMIKQLSVTHNRGGGGRGEGDKEDREGKNTEKRMRARWRSVKRKSEWCQRAKERAAGRMKLDIKWRRAARGSCYRTSSRVHVHQWSSDDRSGIDPPPVHTLQTHKHAYKNNKTHAELSNSHLQWHLPQGHTGVNI